MAKIYYLDDYRRKPLTVDQIMARVQHNRERAEKIKQQLINEVYNDRD